MDLGSLAAGACGAVKEARVALTGQWLAGEGARAGGDGHAGPLGAAFISDPAKVSEGVEGGARAYTVIAEEANVADIVVFAGRASIFAGAADAAVALLVGFEVTSEARSAQVVHRAGLVFTRNGTAGAVDTRQTIRAEHGAEGPKRARLTRGGQCGTSGAFKVAS